MGMVRICLMARPLQPACPTNLLRHANPRLSSNLPNRPLPGRSVQMAAVRQRIGGVCSGNAPTTRHQIPCGTRHATSVSPNRFLLPYLRHHMFRCHSWLRAAPRQENRPPMHLPPPYRSSPFVRHPRSQLIKRTQKPRVSLLAQTRVIPLHP